MDPEIPDLCFVVLVGDGSWGPEPFCVAAPWEDVTEDPPVNYPADNQYVYLDGTDHYADLLLSRFPAGNEDELDLQVSGLIQYERNPSFEPGPMPWLTGITAIASWECDGPPFNDPGGPHHCNDDPDWQWAQRTMSDFGDYYFWSNDDYWTCDEYYYRATDLTCPVTPEGVKDRIEEGRSWLTVIGHGTPAGWLFRNAQPGSPQTYPVFAVDQVFSLQNHGMLPFVFSVACQVANWTQAQPSFTKAWMCAGSPENPAGAVGFLGATTDISWTPPLFALGEAVKVLLGLSPNASQAGTIGAIYFAGLAHMLSEFSWFEEYSDLDKRNIYLHTPQCWVIHGDCSMQVRTLPPQELEVVHPSKVGIYGVGDEITFEIGVTNLSDGDQVAVTLLPSGGTQGNYPRGLLDYSQPSAQFTLPATEDAVYDLTVSGLNKMPYEATIELTETYRGMQSGVQRVCGGFLIDGDVLVVNSLDLVKCGTYALFYVDNTNASQHEFYGGLADQCDIVLAQSGDRMYSDVDWFGYVPGIQGSWGGFKVYGESCEFLLDGCVVVKTDRAIHCPAPGTVHLQECTFAQCTEDAVFTGACDVEIANSTFEDCKWGLRVLEGFARPLVTGCIFRRCSDSGVYIWGGVSSGADVSGSMFEDCTWGIRAENTSSGTAIDVTSSTFISNDVSSARHIEIVGYGRLDIGEGCHFEHHNPSMGYAVIYRGSAQGQVADCFFESGPFANAVPYHGVECRTNNDDVEITSCHFTGQGGFNCSPSLALNNYGVFAFGNIATNRPRLRSNLVQQYWHGVGAEQAVPDLGLVTDYGENEFYENCCDVRYGGMTAEPPEMMPAYGNCWDGSTTPSSDDICGNWADHVGAYPGSCGLGKGVPALIPASLGLRVEGPNPFSEVAGIALDLPERPTGDVTVEVVDLAGRVVKQFSLRDPAAGTYRFEWDGRGVDGSAVPSGVYVCRARVSGRLLAGRIVYLKADLDQQ